VTVTRLVAKDMYNINVALSLSFKF
jgi:hypothetical protein